MNFFVQHSELRDLYDKVAAGERISEADALRLLESKDLNTLGAIADLARQKKVGNRASYIVNRYINYSNLRCSCMSASLRPNLLGAISAGCLRFGSKRWIRTTNKPIFEIGRSTIDLFRKVRVCPRSRLPNSIRACRWTSLVASLGFEPSTY